VGLPPGGEPRRTPGLRREEIAELAHMSVDYYARLEQARGPRPSARVLDALTGALRLTPAERAHLFRLAGTGPTPPPGPSRRVRPHVAALLDRIPGTAAIVTDAGYDVIAANALARALFDVGAGAGPGVTGERGPGERVTGEHGPGEPRVNLARRRFLGAGRSHGGSEPPGSSGSSVSSGSAYAEEFGHVVVSRLRQSAARYPHDAALGRLLAELREGSEEFRAIWDADPVHAPGHRAKSVTHPVLGTLRVTCDVLLVPEDDQQVVFVTADPGSPSARALSRLPLTP
jgi:transcriptional regulator with XRE-family HTH domain